MAANLATLPRLRERPLALALWLTIVGMLAMTLHPAESSAKVKLVAKVDANDPSKLELRTLAPRGSERVAFFLDGSRRWVDESYDWRFGHDGFLHASQAEPGRHQVTTEVVVRHNQVRRAKRVVYLQRKAGTSTGGRWTLNPPAPAPAPAPSADLLFNGDQLSDYYPQSGPGAITEVPDPLGSGGNVIKMTVGDNDVYPITPTENPRASAASPYLIKPGDEFWLKAEFMLPASHPSSVPGWETLVEVYGPPFAGPSPWKIHVAGNEIMWQRNSNYGNDIPWRMPMVRGRWVSVLLHERFATDGFVEMWIDGQRVTFSGGSQRLSMQTMDSSNNGGLNLAKIMNYRKKGMFDSTTVYYKPLKFGQTRASVDS